MTDITISRRAVTAVLAALPTLALTSTCGSLGRAANEGDKAMNVHGKFFVSQWESATAYLDQATAALRLVLAKSGEVQTLHWSMKPIDNYVAFSPVGDTIEAYHQRNHDAKLAQDRAMAEWEADPLLHAACEAIEGALKEFDAALSAVLTAPAPNPAAIAKKLELASQNDIEIADLDGVFADLHRLQFAT